MSRCKCIDEFKDWKKLWSKTLVQIQVAISPLQTQVQSPLGACVNIDKYRYVFLVPKYKTVDIYVTLLQKKNFFDPL